MESQKENPEWISKLLKLNEKTAQKDEQSLDKTNEDNSNS